MEPATGELASFKAERTSFEDHRAELRANLAEEQKRQREIVRFLLTWGDQHPQDFVTLTMQKKLRKQGAKILRLEEGLADFERLMRRFDERLGVPEGGGDDHS